MMHEQRLDEPNITPPREYYQLKCKDILTDGKTSFFLTKPNTQ
jgi:hypothetical protein